MGMATIDHVVGFATALGVLLPVLTGLVVAAGLAGLAGLRIRGARRCSDLGHPLVALVGAAVVTALAGAAQWWITHAIMAGAFAPAPDGWTRVASVGVDLGPALDALARVQTVAATCVGILVGLSWVCACLHDRGAQRSSRVASGASVLALSVPVLAACGGVHWIATAMLEPSAEGAIWSGWHALEASKWMVAGLAATALMAATPIVVHAASRGHVVGRRLYQLAQAMLLVGLAAWSTSRFANEDLVRGPMSALSRGRAPWRADARARALPPMQSWAVQLPVAARCSEVGVESSGLHVLPLQLDAGGHEQLGPNSWPDALHGEGVVAAAIDRRAPGAAFIDALVRAQALGATRVAVVTTRSDAEVSLTFGTVHTQLPCVLGWIGMDHALSLAADGGRWNTLAYAAGHTEDRPHTATAARRRGSTSR